MQVTKVDSGQSTVVSLESELHPRFAANLQQLLFPSLKPTLAVALSGGADSLALTLLAQQWAQQNGADIVALTVDHGLRTESRTEAERVAAMMQLRGIAHHILTPAPQNDSNNLQENARQRRYDALAEFCHAQGIFHCLIAHHAGDVRETVAMHQARGKTADGASGIAAARNYRGVRFVRPLLEIERAQLEEFLRKQKITWIDDPSNQNTNFARVRVRQQLVNDAASSSSLTETATQEATGRHARDEALAEAAVQCVMMHPLGYAELSLSAWKQLEPQLASQMLADCLTTIGGHTRRPRGYETAWLAEALQQSFSKRTLHHCEISVRGDILRIAREYARVDAPIILKGKGKLIWDRRFHVQYNVDRPITLRALGAKGKKPHPALRDLPLATPSFWHLDELVFVPHMTDTSLALPPGVQLRLGFAPAKPLAAAPFWWLNH